VNHTVLEAGAWWNLKPEQRVALRKWLKEHSMEADNIPMGEPIYIENNTIVYWEIQREANGKPKTQKDEGGELRIIAEERRIPLLSPPPGTSLRA